jgi:hypothetical protein
MPPKQGVAMRIRGWGMITSVDDATRNRVLRRVEEIE